MTSTRAYATHSATTPIVPFTFEARPLGARDVSIDILFCGVCHSDIHQARNEWGGSAYPMVPGHEIVGRVREVGAEVTKVAVGDLAAVGCMVDSCRVCASCKDGEEQHCETRAVWTYNSTHFDGTPTYGGYAERITVDEAFTLVVPKGMDLARTAPLLCAGITTWSPLKHWGIGPGHKVAIVGLGGLGHMGLKLAHSLGAHVTQLTTSPGKADDARRLGADDVVVTRDAAAVKALRGRFDFILDTVSAPHDLGTYLGMLARNGSMVLVGLPEKPAVVAAGMLAAKRRRLAGSSIGGIAETQEMLDYCAAHDLAADIELIPIQKINEAYDRLMANDVKYRFVIDMASLR
ncbi:MAG: NAD(P)-dependent alcohol dehydrogenase [Myxococcota bacterium]